MIDGLILVRSNVNHAMDRHIERVKIEEEKEKAAREARWEAERKERERLDEEFKLLHPNMCAHTYFNRFNELTFSYYYGGYCTINFYEWSDINRKPITWHYRPELYRFLDECGLLLNADEAEIVKNNSEVHIICKPNSKELLCSSSKELLNTLFAVCCKASEAK